MQKSLFLLTLAAISVAFVACEKKDEHKAPVEATKEVAPAGHTDAHAAPAAAAPAADAHAAAPAAAAPAADAHAAAPAADAHAAAPAADATAPAATPAK